MLLILQLLLFLLIHKENLLIQLIVTEAFLRMKGVQRHQLVLLDRQLRMSKLITGAVIIRLLGKRLLLLGLRLRY